MARRGPTRIVRDPARADPGRGRGRQLQRRARRGAAAAASTPTPARRRLRAELVRRPDRRRARGGRLRHRSAGPGGSARPTRRSAPPGVRVVRGLRAAGATRTATTLQVTAIAVADELAAAADLVKAKLAGRPVAVVRGLAAPGRRRPSRDARPRTWSAAAGAGHVRATAARRRCWPPCWPPPASRTATRSCCDARARRRAAAALLGRRRRSTGGSRSSHAAGRLTAGGRPRRTVPAADAGVDSAVRCDSAAGLGRRATRLARAREPGVTQAQRDRRRPRQRTGPRRRARPARQAPAAATVVTGSPRSRRPARRSSVAARSCLLVICVVLAVGPAGLPASICSSRTPGPQRRHRRDRRRASAAAGCDPVAENAATGNQEHVAEGTKVDVRPDPARLGRALPHPGPVHQALLHRPTTGPRSRPWCTTSSTATRSPGTAPTLPERPGHAPCEQIARTFGSETYDPAQKFIAAPWTERRRRRFPAGKNVVLARWTADPGQPGRHRRAEGRPPVLHRGQRPGDQGLHGQVPRRQLPGAQRRVTPAAARPDPSRPCGGKWSFRGPIRPDLRPR